MRHFFIRAGLLVLAVILWGGAHSSAHAQRIPPGSYLQTCRDVQMRGWNNLEARCETGRRGQFRFSQLNDVDRCRGDISNRNGQLWCERRGRPGPGPGPNPGPRPGTGNGPQGSYRQSCGQINQVGNVLRATCRDQRGRWVESRLDMLACAPRSDISNRNGQLSCPPIPPPPGPYRQSCRNIRVAGLWLAAECQNMNGRWREARLNLATCHAPFNIMNFNGALMCR
ncbi:MAG: CVNH domain-containing protein [Xanthobacter sp.]